jgi:RNA polymerase sigma-70 factor, ECF subfamily
LIAVACQKNLAPDTNTGMASERAAAWIVEYGSFVWRVLRHLGVPEQQLEDLSQEVYLVMFRQVPNFAERASPRTWIYAICRNIAANARRRVRRKPEFLTSDLPEVAALPSQCADLERARARALIRDALADQPEATRMVFVLYELECMPMHEVVQVVGIPASSGYAKLHAARRRIRRRLLLAGLDAVDLAEVG